VGGGDLSAGVCRESVGEAKAPDGGKSKQSVCGELEVSLGGRRSALAGRPVVGLVPIVVLGLVHLERLDKLAVVERPSAVVGEAGGEEGVHLQATRGKSDPKETCER
jgi:hypothetical protein